MLLEVCVFHQLVVTVIVTRKEVDGDWCRSGRHLTDDEVSGMLIGLLLAGQHTSSTTSSWLAFFLAKHPHIQVSHICLRLSEFCYSHEAV